MFGECRLNFLFRAMLQRKKRLLLFINPTSGRGRGMVFLSQLTPVLQKDGWVVDVIVEHPSHLNDIGDVSQIHAIIVIGGDGTLRSVIERIGELAGLAQVPPLLVIGLGTANLMQQHLKLVYTHDNFAEEIARMLRRMRVVHVDIASANNRLFLLMAGCGFDAAVVHKLSSVRKGPITKWAYFFPIVHSLQKYHFPRISVDVDSKRVLNNQSAMVFVGNIPEYGTGSKILLKASSFDRKLDICIMPADSRKSLVYMWLKTFTGKHVDVDGVFYGTGREVSITGETAPLQIDGEAAGESPVNIRLLPERIGFIVQ